MFNSLAPGCNISIVNFEQVIAGWGTTSHTRAIEISSRVAPDPSNKFVKLNIIVETTWCLPRHMGDSS